MGSTISTAAISCVLESDVILAEQVQSQVCVVDANVRVPSSSPLVDLLPFDDSPDSEGGSTKGCLATRHRESLARFR